MVPLGANFSPDDTPLDIVLYSGRWYQHRHLLILNMMLVIPLITSYANGYDGSMMNGLQSVDEWKEYFGHPTSRELGLFNAIQSIGALAAIPPAPFLSDRYGRRAGILAGAIITLAGAITQTLTTNLSTFVVARFMIGFGTTLAMMASPLLISELAYPTHRAPLTALYNSLWFSGQIVAGWSTFGTFRIPNDWSWRIPSALQGVASVLQLVFVWFIPDSPRWLVSVGRDQEARDVLKKWHAGGEDNNGLVQFEYQEIKNALAAESKRGSAWIDLFRTPGNRRRMRIILAIALFSQWSGNGLISYYLERVLSGIHIESSRDQTLINGCIAIWNLLWAAGAAMFVDRLGRRKLFLTSNIGMLIGFSMLTTCAGIYEKSRAAQAGHGVIASLFLYQAAYAIGYTPLLVSYTVEILPFFLRAKGLAMMYFCVTSALIFNQYTNPVALEALKWKYYLIYTVWLVFELIFIYFFAVETRNRSLEETAALFDGDVALPDMVAMEPRPELVVDQVSLQSSKVSSVPEGGDHKPRVFDGREGFQLYDLGGKAGSHMHIHSYTTTALDTGYFLIRQWWFPTRPLTIAVSVCVLAAFITSLVFGIIYYVNSFKVALPWRRYCYETAPFPPANYSTLAPVGVFLGVLTIASGYERRMMIRESYAAHPASRIPGTERTIVRFIMGLPTGPDVQSIQIENDIYNDIIVLPIKENMNDGKSFRYFEWAYHHALVPPPAGLPELNNRTVVLAPHDPTTTNRGWVQPDYVLKVDDDSFVMLGEIEARLRVTPRSLTYWGYVVKKKFMGGESYALSFDLVQYVATSTHVRAQIRGEEDQVTARWMKAHPRASEIVWWGERCWVYDHPKAGTVYSKGFLFPSEIERVRTFEATRDQGEPQEGAVDVRWSSVSTYPHRYTYKTATHWPTRYVPPRSNLSLPHAMEALIEGSGMSLLGPDQDPRTVYDQRESWEEKFRGAKVGGSVVVHYVKRREWWLECVEVLLGGMGVGLRPR
ncbi:sugar porter (SP) family MFS transporter [Rhizoctonia solani AG-3 Rhs1AP]|uniref:Sugar porter (SP) family MFS transporter n=1 Tax=Rhizoctonia solani AG-3 Rhs1AP TaxID=1086054 RepID=X8J197_9AGAM|nr:sugar porter (SP) family MFS transporter [Rhizoctonia solani AG-3 Rhs1AP]